MTDSKKHLCAQDDAYYQRTRETPESDFKPTPTPNFMRKEKAMQIRVPLGLYEEFFRHFPGRGERKQLLLSFMEAACASAKEKDSFTTKVIERMKEDGH